MINKRFHYKTADEIKSHARELGLDLPWSENIDSLFSGWSFGNLSVANRFLIHPMEGFDAKPDGSPGDLSFRRYQRFSSGGSGLIWAEATSVTEEGRSNPAQLFLHQKNIDSFKHLVERIHAKGKPVGSDTSEVRTIIQLTHSGRYAKPEGSPAPRIVTQGDGLPEASSSAILLNDDDLKRIRDAHIDAASLARRAGFDGVDIKACHGYLLHELLFARERANSIYGGPELQKRLRLMKEIIEGVRQTEPQLVISARINVYDGLDQGFGVSDDGSATIDLSEVETLMNTMDSEGVSLWSVSAGIPYINPWIGRPFDKTSTNSVESPEHQLTGVARMIHLCSESSKFTSNPVVGAELSWLRHFFPNVAAGIIEKNMAMAVGVGRLGIAYPDLVSDLYREKEANIKKVCIACSGCTNRMRNGLSSGCIVRDRDFYA